ncbi:MAG: hypothetical protein ACRCXT_23930 [Paraclostridium sp.]
MKILNEYKTKRKAIEFASNFYDNEKSIIQNRLKKLDKKANELKMLEEIAESKDVKSLLKEAEKNVRESIKFIKKYCDIMRYDKISFLKLIVQRFDNKDWYNKDMEKLKKNIWKYRAC